MDVSDFSELPTDDSDEESDCVTEQSCQKNDDRITQSTRFKQGIALRQEEGSDEDLPLGERVSFRACKGRDNSYQDSAHKLHLHNRKRQRAERKIRAIAVASQRLQETTYGRAEAKLNDEVEITEEIISNSKRPEGFAKMTNAVYQNALPPCGSVKNFEVRLHSKHKKSKHAPSEQSSKRSYHFLTSKPDLNSSGVGVSIGANRYRPRDPRMVSLSGRLDVDLFEKRYEFLAQIREKEIELLKRRVKAWTESGKKGRKERRKLGMTNEMCSLEEDQHELTRLLQDRAERKKVQVTRAAKQSVKKKIRDEVATGKRGAYYPKRSELRKMEIEAKFDEIRKQGGNDAVDKAITKRRKKNASMSHKLMPPHLAK